jgi:multidrug efflux system membrane fusion protein
MDEQVGRTEVDTDTLTRDASGRRRSRLRPILLVLGLLLLGIGAWWLLAPHGTGKPGRPVAPAQPVGAARIATADLPVVLQGLGTVTPLATITVQTQINGQLMAVGFQEGQIVQKGDLLALIDPRPYQVALDQAEGTLEHDQQLLAQAQSDLQRYQQLNRQDSIAKQQVTDQEFLVKQDAGTVKVDQAAVASAQLNLVYCHITAPVTGRVGLRLVDPGNYVQTSNTTGLVVLTQLQPISVIFVLPEDDIAEVWQEVRAGQKLQVTAYNRTNAKLIGTGTLTSVDNEVDTTTGTVKLRATFPNADESLFPNEFVNARLLVRTLPNVTVAPVAAVQNGAPGSFVYLIKPDNTVAVQKVTTGVTEGDQVQILSGVKPGDTVVVDGADRLRDGSKVQIAPDQGDQAATVNNGPGAPPGQQPGNAVPVPPNQRVSGKPPQARAGGQPNGQPNGN